MLLATTPLLTEMEAMTVKTFVPLLPANALVSLPDRARDVVEYRKSGLSLNHVQGCPLGCAYCIRHTTAYGTLTGPLR